jgi:hypothetical protein
VKFGKSNPVYISTNGLENVSQLLKASIQEYNTIGDPLPLGSKLLFINEQKSVNPNVELSSIYGPEDPPNDYDNPLIIKVEGQEKG